MHNIVVLNLTSLEDLSGLLVTTHQRGNAHPDAPASTYLVLRRTRVCPRWGYYAGA